MRRRLFQSPGEPAEVESIVRQFCASYRSNAQKLPVETQRNEYFERLRRAYPIHPEVLDRLYEDWSTLEKFQRTRGVLQYMAIVIHQLWNSENKDAMILPRSLPLEEPDVRTKSIQYLLKYLPQSWDPVLEREVDGKQSEPYRIDGHDTRFGSVQAARRTARAISAPSTREQTSRGIKVERILLGAVQPGQSISDFEDVLKRLQDRLHYLYSHKERYWLDTKPNLRREMESRKQRIDEPSELLPLLKKRTKEALEGRHQFGGVHVCTPSDDVPDDCGPRLVVLPTANAYSRSQKTNQAFVGAKEILHNRTASAEAKPPALSRIPI